MITSVLCPGEVVLLSMPADSPPEGWDPSHIDNQRYTPTASFTQEDVNDGTVWYRHFGSSYDTDSFSFQVSACFASLTSEVRAWI